MELTVNFSEGVIMNGFDFYYFIISSHKSSVSVRNCVCIQVDILIKINLFLQPKAVFFTCMDSRMIPTRFTKTNVGDMFVGNNF